MIIKILTMFGQLQQNNILLIVIKAELRRLDRSAFILLFLKKIWKSKYAKININLYYFLQLQTLGGDFITIAKDPETNKLRIFSLSGASNVKVSNIKTKFGLVHVIDTVLTWNPWTFSILACILSFYICIKIKCFKERVIIKWTLETVSTYTTRYCLFYTVLEKYLSKR